MEECSHVRLALGYADGAPAGPNMATHSTGSLLNYFRGPVQSQAI